MTETRRERVPIGGCVLSRVTRRELLDGVERWIAEGRRNRYITAMNVGKLVLMQDDARLAAYVKGSAAVIADGTPVYLASRLAGDPVPERITGVDLMEDLLDLAHRKGYRVYLLGAKKEVLEETVRRCGEKYPGMTLAGSRDGYFSPGEEGRVVEEIAAASPDILLVGLGLPQKEYFVADHGERLNASVILPVGGGFDVFAGAKKRAPAGIQAVGLEWLWRSVYDRSKAGLVRRSALPFARLTVRAVIEGRLGRRGER